MLDGSASALQTLQMGRKMVRFQDIHSRGRPSASPEKSEPSADMVLEGAPRFMTWPMANLPSNVLAAGIWEATPGAWKSNKGTTSEFFTVLSGVSEFEEQGGSITRFSAGDTFIMRSGCIGVWRVLETTRKSFVTFKD